MRRGNVCAIRVLLQKLSPVCSAARLVYEHRSEGRRVARRGAARRSASPSVAKRRGAAQSSAEQCEWPPGPMALRALLYKLIEHYANEQHHVLLVPADLVFLRYMFSAPLLCANRVECEASLRDLKINYVRECARGRLYGAVPGPALTFASRHGSVRWLSSPSRGFSSIGDCGRTLCRLLHGQLLPPSFWAPTFPLLSQARMRLPDAVLEHFRKAGVVR